MIDESPASPRRLDPERIATELGGAAIPEGYVCFRGYLAAGNGATQRIVVDEQFVRWLEVNTEDIAARLDVPAQARDPRDWILVRRGARMTKCEVGYAPEIADQGWGVDFLGVSDAAAAPDGDPDVERRRPPPPPY